MRRKSQEQHEPMQDKNGKTAMPKPENEPLVEAKAIAEYLGVKESWVKDQVRSRVPKERQIPHYKLGEGKGTYLRFRISLVDVWLEWRRQGFSGMAR